MENFLNSIPEEKLNAFIMVIGSMFLAGIVIMLLFGALNVLFNLDSNLEYVIQKIALGLMAPGITLVALGLVVLIGINVKELIK